MRVLGLLVATVLLFFGGCSGNASKEEDVNSKKEKDKSAQDAENAGRANRVAQIQDTDEDDYELKVFAQSDEIEHPNGLLVEDGRLIVAGWGLEIQDDFTTKTPGKLVALDILETKQEDITKSPTGNLDGVESDGDGGYYVSDWIAGKVFHIHGGGHVHEVLSLPQGTADLAFLADKKLLIIPQMLENKVTAFDFSATEEENSDEGPPEAWSVTEGIKKPESAYYDADSDVLFLSQIGDGSPMDKDGDGYISKLSTDGKMIENKWVTGLNAPKGLRSHAGTLWVADIDRLVAIDIKSGEKTKEVPVPEAKFLNDVVCDEEGTVYVSDLLGRKIYSYRRKK